MTSENQIALCELPVLTQFRFFVGFLLKLAVVYGVFLALLEIKNLLCFSKVATILPVEDGTILFALLVLFYCVVYDIFFIISEGIIRKMLGGIIVSLVGSVLCAIFPPLGIVIAILGIFSMVKSIVGVVKMIPYLLLGVLITACLFLDNGIAILEAGGDFSLLALVPHFSLGFFRISPLMIPYLVLTFFVSVNLSFRYSLKMALFRQTVIFLAIPIIIIMFYLIRSALERAVCEPVQMRQASVGKNGKIFVQPYIRSNGTVVSGYWRRV